VIQDDVLAECRDKMAKARDHLQGELFAIVAAQQNERHAGSMQFGFSKSAQTRAIRQPQIEKDHIDSALFQAVQACLQRVSPVQDKGDIGS